MRINDPATFRLSIRFWKWLDTPELRAFTVTLLLSCCFSFSLWDSNFVDDVDANPFRYQWILQDKELLPGKLFANKHKPFIRTPGYVSS